MTKSELSLRKKFSYGVGHVLNDLTASMWFSYLLIYLNDVVNFQPAVSGYMMLIGQIADAISTVVIGFLSDRTKTGICHYGRRKSWQLIGDILVLLSFPFMFNLCITCENASEKFRFIYYIPFVVIFQFGWASTQISHLSLIPQLSTNQHERVTLNSIRYAFTIASNLFVYVTTYLLLKYNKIVRPKDDIMPNEYDKELSRADAPKFMYLSFIVCCVGVIFQMIFHTGTNEKKMLTDEQIQTHSMSDSCEVKLNWLGYLKNIRFYYVAVLYMCTRLIVNMAQVYLPMYLTDTLQLDKSFIALIPLVCYLSGFISTFPLRFLTKRFGSYLTCFIGLCFIYVCCLLFWLGDVIISASINSALAALLLGCGSTIILITSLSLTTDLIGKNTASGAFIYGTMSFGDKLSNGVAVALLQQFSPCNTHQMYEPCEKYYVFIMSLLPLLCAVVATVTLFALYLNKKMQKTMIFPQQENFEYQKPEVNSNELKK